MVEKVLIADEDVSVRDFLYDLISEIGFVVLTIPTGEEALEHLKKEKPAFLIIDDKPGEFNGVLLAKKIREFDKDIRIIMLGQEANYQALASHLKEADVSAFLKKDFQDANVIRNLIALLKHESFLKPQHESFLKPQSEKQGGSILVVDDEQESSRMTSNFLKRRGFEVETAASGEECLEKIKEKDFDVVLLDITMEGMDGLLTLKRLKSIRSNAIVIMVTAHQNKEMLAQAKEFGATYYITKPFDLGSLEACLLPLLLNKKK